MPSTDFVGVARGQGMRVWIYLSNLDADFFL